MNSPTPGPGDVWFPPSCLAHSYRSAGWRVPVPPVWHSRSLLRRPGAPPPHPTVLCLPSVVSYMRSDWEGLLIWICSPPHFGSPADRAGSSSSALDPAYILQPKYSWNSSRSRTGASRGDALPISAPSRLLSLQPGGEVCVCESVGERGRGRHRDRELGTQTGDYTGELGDVRWLPVPGAMGLSSYLATPLTGLKATSIQHILSPYCAPTTY